MSASTSNNSKICMCGKKRMSLNLTNWNRHLTSCSVAKLKTNKICTDVSSFFCKKNASPSKKSMYYLKHFNIYKLYTKTHKYYRYF